MPPKKPKPGIGKGRVLSQVLSGGDRRSIGQADQVVEFVRQHPKSVSSLVECLWHSDVRVCMRAADALEKLSCDQADLLQPSKAALLGLLEEATQKEVRWHLALMVPRLRLTDSECGRVAEALQSYLDDRSSIVKTFAMQGLADLTSQDPSLRPVVIDLIGSLTRTGTPAMRARGRKLLERLDQP